MNIPAFARRKAWVWDLWLAGITGSNSTRDISVCLSVVNIVWCQVEFSANSDLTPRGVLTSVCVCVIECDQVKQ